VRVIATEKSKPIEIGGWKLGETASKAVQNLINYMQGFVRFLINFVIFILPVLVTLFLPVYLVFIGLRALVRKRRAKKADKEVTEEK
jgi:predicted membrane protein